MTENLSRNRNYRLLWTSQAIAEFGYHTSTIAFPLLVLALTGSAALSGLVLGTMAVAQLVAGLPGGALADRWHRKRIMLGCEAAQFLAAASLAVALWLDIATVPHLFVVAAVFGLAAAMFEPAEDATLATIVPADQLATAVALNSARGSVGQLAGTSAGGFLFAAGRALPFGIDAIAHGLAFILLAFLKVPARVVRPEVGTRLSREIGEGLRWVWRQPHIRVMAACVVVLNLFFTAFYLVVIVLTERRGVPAGEIGVMAAMLGAGGILGALIAPLLHRVLSPYLSIVGVFWAVTVLTPIAAVLHSGYLMGALFAGMSLLAPTANTTIVTQQLTMTPDHLRGRLTSVVSLATGVAAAAGPVLGGLLVSLLSETAAVLACAAGIAVVTVLVTISRTLRTFPSTDHAEEPSLVGL